MPLLSGLSSFLRNLFRKEKREQELAEEIDVFLELLIDQKIEQGLAPEDARRAALIEFGGREQVREKVREVSAGHFLETCWRDMRFGLRVLRKSPAFTALAILTLTLGIGANTAIFSVVDAVLLRPLPYPYQDQLVHLYETNTSIIDSHEPVSAPNFIDWRAMSRSFSGMAALDWVALTMTGGAEADILNGQRVTPGMLNILGFRPTLGRDFSNDDATPGRDHVVLLSHELWTQRFAGDPSIIGRRLKLNFESYTVIGVLPPGFRTPSQFGVPGLLIPLAFDNTDLQNRGHHHYQVFARLRPTVTPAQAQVDMEAIAERLAKTYSNNEGRGVRAIPLLDDIVGNYRQSLLLIFAAAGLILLIACANLANALLARGVGQRHEIAVRLALGASRLAIIRQILVQNLILAAFGCATGVLAAFWVLKGLQGLAPNTLPRVNEVAVNGDTLTFAIGASLLAGLSFGLLTALQLSGTPPYDALKGRGAASAGSSVLRWRDALIVAQVALSIVLLVGAGLLLKSFARLRGIDLGFQPDSTLAMKIILPKTKYPEPAARLRFFTTLTDRASRLPGVEAVGYTNHLPMLGIWGGSFRVEHPEVPMGPQDDSDFQVVSSGYFQALRLRLLRGRLFNEIDRPGAEPVVIVNHAFAHRYWPNSDPIGQRLKKGNLPLWTIVGVVDDVHLNGPSRPANIEIYFPADQAQSLPASPSDFAVRSSGDPLNLIKAIRREVSTIDSEQPVTNIQTMDEVLGQNRSAARFSTLLLAVFAGLALLLATMGIYGIVSYSIAQRSQEIGIRMAIGARPAEILGLILRQIAPRIALGALLGIAVSLALSRYAATMLFGVSPRDPATFAIALSVLVAAGLAATIIPARRAMRIDPIIVLRVE